MRQGEEFRLDARQLRRTLDAATLAPFTRLSNARGALGPLLTALNLAALLTAAVWAWRAGQWAWLVPIVALVGAQQHALFVLAHEAAHYRLFTSRTWNDAVGRLAGSLGGISMCTYRVTHRLHHNHLYDRQDPDLALNAGYPRGRAYLWRKLLIDLTGWTAPKTFAYFFGAPAINAETAERVRPLDDTAESLRAAARRDRWVVVALHVAMPLVALAAGGWSGLALYALVWVLPLVTVLQALLRLRAVAEHGAPAGYDSPLRAARTNLPARGPIGWLTRIFFFPHHVNYHIEHHLYPAVPHYRLAALHRALAQQGLLVEAEVRPFAQTLARVFAERGTVATPARTAGT